MRVTPEIHRQALKLFTETWPRNKEESRLLLERCGDDAVLRQEVESLLKAEADSGDFIAEPLLRLPKIRTDELAPGDMVGPYRIERLLGRGGMGTVYLVDKDYPNRSALKIVRTDPNRDGVMRRFQQEQEILARLDHPNIVKPEDRGVTADGDPYLVMNYVEGEPIDRYCALVPIEERLEVFRKVCSAVHYAHQNLIVHRDLKPANILVTAEGEPKILDFGIAQLEDSSPYSTRAETLRQTTSVFLGTLRYASPEQVHNEGQLTTGSDVYSLGVLLYELLAGRHPFEEACNSFVDLGRAICEATPEKPSAVARLPEVTDPPEGTENAGPETQKQPAETIDHEALRHKIAGDLDAIVLKAMNRKPVERYGSAEELSDDLRRHQDGELVEARESTWRYWFSKRTQEYSRQLKILGVMLLIVLASLIRLHFWLEEIEREQQVRARMEANAYLLGSFEVANPSPSISAKDLLDANVPRVDEAIEWEVLAAEGDSKLQSQYLADVTGLLDSFGWAYFGLGALEDAEGWLSKAWDRFSEGPSSRESVLNQLRLSAARGGLGELESARQLRAEALSLLETKSFDDEGFAQLLNDTAYLLEDRGDFEAAEAIFRAVLDMKRRVHGDREISVAIGLSNLGSVLGRVGRYEDAVAAHRESFEIRSELFEAESTEDEAIEVLERSRNNLATALRDLAWSRQDPDDPAWDEAKELFEHSRSARRRLNEPSLVATVENNWALLEMYLGRLSGDRRLLESSQERFGVALEVFDRGHSWPTGVVLRNRATLLQALGEPMQAEADARRAVLLFDNYDQEHWRVLDAKSVLGGCLLDLGELEEAAPLIRESVEKLEAKPVVPALQLEQARQRLERLNLLEQRRVDG